MKKSMIYAMVIVLCFCMFSCKTTDQATSDKNEFGSGGGNALGNYHGFESYLSKPYIFIGEFTGYIFENAEGKYCKEFHVLENIRGETEEYILFYNYYYAGVEDRIDNDSDLPFVNGEKYLIMTDKVDNIYKGTCYMPGVIYCPIDRFNDAFMLVLGERKRLDFMTTGSAENFKDYDSFKAYLLSSIETTEAKGMDWPYYIDSDDIYDILTAAPQIFKVKIIGHGNKDELYSDYLCRVEKVYKGDYDPERGNQIKLGFSGETTIITPANHRKHYFEFRLFNADIDLGKTDEYIICNNSMYLIARKGVISLEYTEEEIIQMLEEIYGEVDILEIPEENAVLQ